MEKVPQIVSERLKAAPSALDHPDPDVLTAFSEHSLRKSERAVVVEHLARCGDCREIVALALPAFEPVQEAVRPANSGWLTWPVLRWGFVAAGIVTIASFGIVQYQHRLSMMADETPHPQAITKEANNLPTALPAPESTEDRDKAPTAQALVPTDRKDLTSLKASPTPPTEMSPPVGGPVREKGASTVAAMPHGPRVQWQQNTLQQQTPQSAPAKQLRAIPLPSVPPSGSSESVEVESAAPAVSASVDSSTVQNKIDQQALQNGRTETTIKRSKPATTTVATPSFPAPASAARAQLTGQSAQANAFIGRSVSWTISATGGLRRSLDQGTSWQDIDVNSSSAMGAGVALMKAPAKAKDAAADSLDKKNTSTPLVFRAVASNGPDVWAGASGGLLYHSSDAGGHWTRIIPSASGVSLTGDIVSLEFVDAQHGRVVSSTPEIWITSDGGQSWQKQ